MGKVISKVKTIVSRAVCTCTISIRCNHNNLRLELASVYMVHGVMQQAEPITRLGNDRLVFKAISGRGSVVGTAGLLIFNIVDFSNEPNDSSPGHGQLVIAWKVNALAWDEVPCTILFFKEPQTDFESLYDSLCESVLCEFPPQETTDVVCNMTQWIPTSLGTMCIRSAACKCKSFKSVYYAIEVEEFQKDLTETITSKNKKQSEVMKQFKT